MALLDFVMRTIVLSCLRWTATAIPLTPLEGGNATPS